MKKKKTAFALGLGCAALLLLGLDTRLRVREYTIESNKLHTALSIVLLTDLHSQDYGEGQERLLTQIRAQNPTFLLLGGDILDDEIPHDKGFETLAALAAEYPCYYVSGNHECRTGKLSTLTEQIRALGITVLAGDCVRLPLPEGTLSLCGIDDPDALGKATTLSQLDRAHAMTEEDDFRILLSHRPELVEEYRARGFDLMLSGHAHGGQWRIPGLLNGLLAPHQGLFPSYAGGRYDFNDGVLLVSRGLSTSSTAIPRFYNPTELVVIHLQPTTQTTP